MNAKPLDDGDYEHMLLLIERAEKLRVILNAFEQSSMAIFVEKIKKYGRRAVFSDKQISVMRELIQKLHVMRKL